MQKPSLNSWSFVWVSNSFIAACESSMKGGGKIVHNHKNESNCVSDEPWRKRIDSFRSVKVWLSCQRLLAIILDQYWLLTYGHRGHISDYRDQKCYPFGFMSILAGTHVVDDLCDTGCLLMIYAILDVCWYYCSSSLHGNRLNANQSIADCCQRLR